MDLYASASLDMHALTKNNERTSKSNKDSHYKNGLPINTCEMKILRDKGLMFSCYLCKAQALTEQVHSKVLLTKFWSVALSEQSCCVMNVCCKARQRCESISKSFEFVGNLFLFHIIVGKVISSEFKNVQVGVTMFPTSGPCHCHQNSLSSSSLMSSLWISTGPCKSEFQF